VRNGLTVFVTSSANEEEVSPLHRLSVNLANYDPCAERVFPKLLSIFSICRRNIKHNNVRYLQLKYSPCIAVKKTYIGNNEASDFERLAFIHDAV
jgi:hypothetical protein